MYIREDCDFNDMQIAGITTLVPQGNGWPIDYANSPGSQSNPPTTTGGVGPVDLTNWNAPSNWYSIYDENNHPWKYVRFNNEFVGEHNGTVFPSNRIDDVVGNAPSSECASYLNIPFPQTRVVSSILEEVSSDVLVYPNPVEQGHDLKIVGSQVAAIRFYNSGILSINMDYTLGDSEFLIHTYNLKSGMYFLEIQLLDGTRKTTKIFIQ